MLDHETHSFEYRFRRSNGTYAWVYDEWCLYRDDAGEPSEILGTCIDVTARYAANEKVRFQAQVLDYIDDGLVLTDIEGRITDWNPGAERMFGYSKAEVRGRLLAIIHSAKYQHRLMEEIVATVTQDGKWFGEITFVRKDGSEGLSETIVAEHRDELGELIGTIGIHRDITERRKAEELRLALENRIQTTQKLEGLGVLTGGIAHDFNNLLVGISAAPTSLS